MKTDFNKVVDERQDAPTKNEALAQSDTPNMNEDIYTARSSV